MGQLTPGTSFPGINLLKQTVAPTPAQATAGPTAINDGPSFFLVEAYGGHDDVSARVWIALIKTVPPAVLEESRVGMVAAQDSGPSGSLLLSRKAVSSSISYRFIPAHGNGDVTTPNQGDQF
jgi:hypothetical protein